VTKLIAQELNSRLEKIDTELVAQALPLKYRPLESFKRIYGDLPDGPLRTDLFDKIADWYKALYGKRAEPDGILGRFPVLLRGEVQLVLVPLTAGDAVVRLIDQIEGLSSEIGASLTREEFEAIARKAGGATLSFQKLYNLTVDDGFLDAVERGLVWRGLFDLETAAFTLRQVGDAQNAIFQVHQAAEKFLKVALKRAGSKTDLKRFGHNLPEVFAQLKGLRPRYSSLESSVDAVQALAPNMEIRYSVVPRRLEQAIEGFHAALSISGTLAQMWLFDTKRGSDNSNFSEGSFYFDGNQNKYFCRSVLASGAPPLAVLTRFGTSPLLGRMMFDLSLDLIVSALYLEIKDKDEIATLQGEFDSFIRNPPAHRATAEDVSIKTDSGPEGTYTTAMFMFKS
jgi:HEPN domain-containing protein